MAGDYDRSRGFGELLRDLAHGSANLFRGEVRLARLELTDLATNLARGTTQIAIGGVMLLLGSLSFAVGVVLLAGDQWVPSDLYWVAALIVVVATGTLAAFFAKRGAAQLAPANLAPEQTLETLKEDKEWLKQQLTSGAT